MQLNCFVHAAIRLSASAMPHGSSINASCLTRTCTQADRSQLTIPRKLPKAAATCGIQQLRCCTCRLRHCPQMCFLGSAALTLPPLAVAGEFWVTELRWHACQPAGEGLQQRCTAGAVQPHTQVVPAGSARRHNGQLVDVAHIAQAGQRHWDCVPGGREGCPASLNHMLTGRCHCRCHTCPQKLCGSTAIPARQAQPLSCMFQSTCPTRTCFCCSTGTHCLARCGHQAGTKPSLLEIIQGHTVCCCVKSTAWWHAVSGLYSVWQLQRPTPTCLHK